MSQNPLPPISPQLEDSLWQLLGSGRRWTEYQLMKVLSGQDEEQVVADRIFPEFTPNLDSLEMFRSHFLLFHVLYRLQDQWLKAGQGRLHIHTLGIYLQSETDKREGAESEANAEASQHTAGLIQQDPLKSYYLDYDEFLNTQQADVIALLDAFWERMDDKGRFEVNGRSREQSIQQALNTLDLSQEEAVSAESVNVRFRHLCQRHHPDKGGDAQRFRAICEAREVLIAALP
ncbi:DNA-J related domain-containing protein [Thiomicrorhabdus sp. zzn3]|uniref:DNA-J related domain-containing protein n=1 Tax=Thiomicrorhabdus sp. zzn3 TaxID=3039775 RepID=UPI00243730ED|nr:DNA-J related domain-containing protein [Thiomicrorhabdus sp. zzn3]MDG6777699.1 DNA-J related domain-containing protein [Thiomicrorhabdus sp. zzn3]